jgi:hypothetical protein
MNIHLKLASDELCDDIKHGNNWAATTAKSDAELREYKRTLLAAVLDVDFSDEQAIRTAVDEVLR